MARKVLISYEEVKQVANAKSMLHAAELLGVSYSSFIRYAKKYGLYEPNQGGKDHRKKKAFKYSLDDLLISDIVIGSSKLKARLLEAGLKKNECEECHQCGIWNGKILKMHLDHIDGNKKNNRLDNLRMLCPNCHSQTPTYCRGQSKSLPTLRV